MQELRLAIDEFRLDDEWRNQCTQRREFGELLADATLALGEAKSRLEVTRAEADREIRDSPDDFGVAKPTEAAVGNAVILHPAVKVAQRAVLAAKHKVDYAQAAVDALEHRKRALTQIVELKGQEWFADRIPRGVRKRDRKDEDDDESND